MDPYFASVGSRRRPSLTPSSMSTSSLVSTEYSNHGTNSNNNANNAAAGNNNYRQQICPRDVIFTMNNELLVLPNSIDSNGHGQQQLPPGNAAIQRMIHVACKTIQNQQQQNDEMMMMTIRSHCKEIIYQYNIRHMNTYLESEICVQYWMINSTNYQLQSQQSIPMKKEYCQLSVSRVCDILQQLVLYRMQQQSMLPMTNVSSTSMNDRVKSSTIAKPTVKKVCILQSAEDSKHVPMGNPVVQQQRPRNKKQQTGGKDMVMVVKKKRRNSIKAKVIHESDQFSTNIITKITNDDVMFGALLFCVLVPSPPTLFHVSHFPDPLSLTLSPIINSIHRSWILLQWSRWKQTTTYVGRRVSIDLHRHQVSH